MTPNIMPGSANPIVITPYPSKTYKLSSNRIAGVVDRIEAVEQTIFHILMTERYAYPIYPDNYGVELEQYIGRGLNFLQAGIESTLREALTQDDRIIDIRVTNIEQGDDPDSAIVTFDVFTMFGQIEMGLSASV